ncbi:hypothetical protein ACFFVB_02285 [Formosa undariae]|uniref:Uncharacterized protein n=1 Tax=Formosa undariae TaxID=1325436 RepID=A0ABV5EXI9_9FLAO
MKNIIILAICLLSTTSSFASTYGNITVSNKDDNTKTQITLTLNDVQPGQVLNIKDKEGILLYNTIIKKSGSFSGLFDITELPNGTYHFEHENENFIKHIPFTVSLGQVNFDRANEKSVFKPITRIKNNLIYLSKLDLDKKNVVIDIYYTSNIENKYQLLHSENIEDTVKIERIYRVSKAHKGNYKMVVNADGQSYVEHFKI